MAYRSHSAMSTPGFVTGGTLGSMPSPSDRRFVALARTDSDHFRDREHEDLPVTDRARSRFLDDDLHGGILIRFLNANEDKHLRHEADVHLGATIPFVVPHLLGEALAL